jgi:ABC-type branched-subunit amino acid transport system substrate-binding protein
MFDAIKRANSLDGKAIRDALAATKEYPGVTGKVTFNSDRDAVKPIVMIKIQEGGKFVVQERVQVEGAAMPSAATSASPATTTSTSAAATPKTVASPK